MSPPRWDSRVVSAVCAFAVVGLVIQAQESRPETGSAAWLLADVARREAVLELARRQYPSGHTFVAACLQNVGDALQAVGRPNEAVEKHEEALAMFLRVLGPKDGFQVANSLANLGTCLWEAGRLTESLKRLEAGLEMTARLIAGDSAEVAVCLNNVGACLDGLGRPAEALLKYESALAMQQRLHPDGSADVATSLNNLGRCLHLLGRDAESLQKHETSIRMQKRVSGVTAAEAASGAEGVALCLSTLGRPAEALPWLLEALAMRRQALGEEHPDIATSLNNVGYCLHSLGRDPEALRSHEEALSIFRKAFAHRDHPDVAMSIANRALVLSALGRDQQALSGYREALAMARRVFPSDHATVALALKNVAIAEIGAGLAAEGLAHAEESVAMGRRVGDPNLFVYCTDLGALLADIPGREQEGVRLLEEAVGRIEARRSTVSTVRERTASFSATRPRRLGQLDALMLSSSYFDHLTRTGAFTFLIHARLRERNVDEALGVAERGRARGLLDLIEGRSGHASQPFAAPARVPGIRAGLRPGERLLFYSIGRHESHLFVVSADRETRAFELRFEDATPVGHRDLAAAVEAFVDAASAQVIDAPARAASRPESVPAETRPVRRPIPARYVDRGSELFRVLVPGSLFDELRGCATVYVVPHGPLNALPFEMLVTRPGADLASSRYWIDDGPAIAYAPSGAVLEWCRARRDACGAARADYDVLALGDPVFAATGTGAPGPGDDDALSGALKLLPGTRREVEAIRAAAGAGRTVRTLLGERATKANLTEAGPKARLVHLATHHLSRETETASFSALALTAPKSPSATDDGFLRLSELFDTWGGRLRACELVVLSGCSTQKGYEWRHEAVQAMPIGFLYAGCPAVIASLWKVEDEASADLMGSFYERLFAAEAAATRETRPSRPVKLTSFTEARRALRRTRPHPSAWAPFVYIGDPR